VTLYVFKVEDGATHHVIANHPGEAIDVLATSNGQTRAAYCEEFPDHEIKRLEPHERVSIRLDTGLRPENLPLDQKVPRTAHLVVTAVASCAEWIETHPEPGVLCSTEF
jgi:hypothetical protein